MMTTRTIVVVTAGLSQPSSTRLLADRLAAADARARSATAASRSGVEVIELREHAQDLTNHLLTGFPSPRLCGGLDAVLAADGADRRDARCSTRRTAGCSSCSSTWSSTTSLAGMPVLVAATGGTARHSLVLDHAMRPLFAYLGAATVPTAVFAAAEDWGQGATPADTALAERIDRAAGELARAAAQRERGADATADPFSEPVPFEQLLQARRPG